MRIGVDARELCGKPTGVGRHLLGLLGAWATSAPASRHTFVLYAHQQVATPLGRAELRVVPGSAGTSWEQIALPSAIKRDDVDVFFAPGYTAPIMLKTPTVVLVHDISFVTHPEWFRAKEGLRRRTLTRWASRRAKLVLTVSEAARQEIVEHLSLPANRVRCIYPGVLTLGKHATDNGNPTVLFVGSVFNRRHLPDLIRAFKPIAKTHAAARLEIVGDNRTHPHQNLAAVAVAEGIQTQVAFRSYVSDDELASLYGHARAFAFLSEYEGFGHPPLEALSAGIPSVLIETEVAREVCGDAALYAGNGDIVGITQALQRLLFDESTRQRVLGAAPSVLARYSWSRAATETLTALEDAAGFDSAAEH